MEHWSFTEFSDEFLTALVDAFWQVRGKRRINLREFAATYCMGEPA